MRAEERNQFDRAVGSTKRMGERLLNSTASPGCDDEVLVTAAATRHSKRQAA